MEISAIHLLIIADLLYNARLYRIFPMLPLQPMLLGTCAGLSLFYAGLCYLKLAIKPLCAVIGLFALFLFQLQQFAALSHTSIIWNVAFQYVWLASFTLFYIANLNGRLHYLLDVLASYATLYAAIYLGLSILRFSNVLPKEILDPLILNDLERGNRLYAHAPMLALAWFYWLLKVRSGTGVKSCLLTVLCGLAVLSTVSRVFIVIVALLTLFVLLRMSSRKIGRFALLAFATVSITNLYGVIDIDWNTYRLFSGDSSGSYRIFEYGIARQMIWDHPLFGFGIASSQKAAGTLLGHDYFAAGDLGPTGIWFELGFAGLLFSIFGSILLCRPGVSSNSDVYQAFFLTSCFIGLYGCLSPLLLTGGATFFGITLAIWLGPARKALIDMRKPVYRKTEEPRIQPI